jgi:hypothetical protein
MTKQVSSHAEALSPASSKRVRVLRAFRPGRDGRGFFASAIRLIPCLSFSGSGSGNCWQLLATGGNHDLQTD